MVTEPSRLAQPVYFGDDFELDTRSFELRRAGRAVKLERIPMDLLFLLIEYRGELVSRDQIIERIWGKDVFLDTDNSINAAVRKIRQALKDDPEHPRFVQTVTGKGYRFIAPVRQIEVLQNRPATEPKQIERVVSIEAAGKPPAPALKRPRIAAVAALVVVVAGSFAVVHYIKASRAKRLNAADSIVLGDFANSTGDPIFDETLKTALNVSLRQSPFLNLLSQGKVNKTLKLMTLASNSALTPAVAAEVCQRSGSKAYVSGAIGSLGSEYVIGLKAVNCRTGDILAQEQATASNKEKVLSTLGGAATKLRNELGESLATVQKFDVPLTEATTSSLEALKAYSQGLKAWNTNGEAEAIPFLKRAIELDPQFASAYVSLGTVYSNTGQYILSVESVSKAYALRERVSERERFYILGHYYKDVTGELEKAAPVYKQWQEEYPSDPTPHTNLGNIYSALGRLDDALAQFRDALRVEPNGVLIYENIALTNIYLNRLDDAAATVQAAFDRNLQDPTLHLLLQQITTFRGDPVALQREFSWGMSTPGVEDAILAGQADAEALQGHIEKAREMSQRAAEFAVRTDSKDIASLCLMLSALREAEVGNLSEAAKEAEKALSLAQDKEIQILAALVFARTGHGKRAASIADQLDHDHPLDTLLQSHWLPSIRSAIKLNSGDSAGSVQSLQVALAYDLGAFQPLPALYPPYLRGQAFLQLHQGPSAVSELQKVLDHHTLSPTVPTVLARLQLGRAYAISNDIPKAKKSYEDFFAAWKDADPDVPVLKQAKAEYANLQ